MRSAPERYRNISRIISTGMSFNPTTGDDRAKPELASWAVSLAFFTSGRKELAELAEDAVPQFVMLRSPLSELSDREASMFLPIAGARLNAEAMIER